MPMMAKGPLLAGAPKANPFAAKGKSSAKPNPFAKKK